jgi:hypothetical protein
VRKCLGGQAKGGQTFNDMELFKQKVYPYNFPAGADEQRS